ncbi:MAG: dockerin type I domain-containing protein [Ruminiclostridium sp.]
MKKFLVSMLVTMLLISSITVGAVQAAPAGFVTANTNYFVLDGKPFYFAGTNNYYLAYSSNTMIDDVLNDAKAMELKVIRCWGFIDGASHNNKVMQPSLGVYDNSGFERLDYTIKKAGELGLKLVLPLVNNWDDFGGMNQYVKWTGASKHDDFYTNAACKTAFKNYINYMLNRTNSYNNVKYKDDPAIMTWELGNEPRCDSDSTGNTLVNWANEMSTYIKSLDPNHLVAVGDEGFFNRGGSDYCYNGGSGVDADRLIKIKNIDYSTLHLYPDGWGKTIDWTTQYINDHIALGKTVGKPVVLEEYGVNSSRDSVYKAWGDLIYKNSTVGEGGAGNMFWILTGIQDDGNLYPDYDGFRVINPSTTANVIIANAKLMNAKSGPAIQKGDVNSDGNRDALDLALLKRYLLDNSISIDKTAADMNNDGYVDAIDFAQLKKALL